MFYLLPFWLDEMKLILPKPRPPTAILYCMRELHSLCSGVSGSARLLVQSIQRKEKRIAQSSSFRQLLICLKHYYTWVTVRTRLKHYYTWVTVRTCLKIYYTWVTVRTCLKHYYTWGTVRKCFKLVSRF